MWEDMNWTRRCIIYAYKKEIAIQRLWELPQNGYFLLQFCYDCWGALADLIKQNLLENTYKIALRKAIAFPYYY